MGGNSGEEFEYIVVGSGAGGGVVASRLALAGHTVLVLEAGSDALAEDPEKPGLPEHYQVPCFHALSTENEELRWDYFVRHYGDDERQKRDPKYIEEYGGERRSARASEEVILCGGAFNTPQLLMLSGIGPAEELARHGIAVRVDLPGVGSNLQDRYEVGMVNRMKTDWSVLKGAAFDRNDPIYAEWKQCRTGVYTTNGAVMSIIKKSTDDKPLPDLFVFALMGKFQGYFPGYSKLFPEHLNYLTWAVLKAHTNNTAGTVRLRSADPRDVPLVNFHYFDEGNDTSKQDLEAVVDGINFCRMLSRGLDGLIGEEEMPGKELESREDLRQFVKDHAWGHHASCTCPIGDPEKGGVLNGNFEVHGVKGLRVVDASIFPKIPGFFIAASIYMAAEKASDVIAAAKAKRPR